MDEDEIKLGRTAEYLYRNGQIDHAIAIDKLKVTPENIATQNLLQQCRDTKVINKPDNIQQEIEELKQSKVQNETEHDQLTRNYNTERDVNEIKQKKENNTDAEEKLYIIASNSFQMRLKVLSMELKVVETFTLRGLIENGNDIWKNRDNIENCLKRIDEELLMAENSSTHLMRKIEQTVKKNSIKKEEVKKPKDDIKVLDYRSIVTVRGTKEDVSNCILKAKTALDNGKYDRAESLLLKAERIFPTKNAKDLLKQVRAAKESKQNSDPTENSVQTVEIVNTVKEKEKESKSVDTSINAVKCLEAFEEAFTTGSLPEVKYVKKLKEKNQAKPSRETISSETKYEYDKQKKMEMQIGKETTEAVEIAKPKIRKDDQLERNILRKAIDGQKFENAMSFLNTAEPITVNEHAKELQKNMRVNCFEFPVKANEADKAESLKCIKIAQAAFDKGLYDQAEHFLLESLKIFKSQDAKFFLEIVRNAKAQNITNVKTEKIDNEHVNNHSKAERFTSKSFEMNANDEAQKQPSTDEPIASKPVKSYFDLKEVGEAKLCQDLAVEALICNKFYVACFYLEWALKKRPNEETMELLRSVQVQIDNRKRGHYQSESDVLFEANKLLDKADNFIRIGDLDQAEFFLVLSWTLRKSRRTISIHNKFIEARLALFNNDAANKRDGKDNGIIENIFESDKLVKLALDKYKKHQLEEAEKLLMKAAEFHPSVRIDKLLVEIRGFNNKENGTSKKLELRDKTH